MPDPLSLAAMKAFALGRRAKWKDYVDLYILLKCFFTIDEISDRASVLFASEFNRKLFKQQLIYFNDIDFTEQVVYMPGFEVTEEEIKNFLIEKATEPF